MFDEADDIATRTFKSRNLRSDLRFKSYSDAKLAGLFLDNDFPIVLFEKVFELVRDPAFNPAEITFDDVWDMFAYVSARRRKIAIERESAIPPFIAESHQAVPARPHVPRLVLDLVVDQMIEKRVPIGVAAMETNWRSAFEANVSTFYDMSLVHRSWTSIAQRGLRHRVVVPYQYIKNFLVSPFCGPWITEMIVYWSVENGSVGVTKADIWFFEALLERTPNLRSLAFDSSLLWPIAFDPPSFDVDLCVEIISDMLPNLENLWLKHLHPSDDPSRTSYEEYCDELHTLCLNIPKLQSLKFLSIRSWGNSDDEPPTDLKWDEHPPPSLKTIELDLCRSSRKDDLTWLFKARGDYCPRSLAIAARGDGSTKFPCLAFRDSLKECLPSIEQLQLCLGHPSNSFKFGDPTYFSDSFPFINDLLLTSSSLRQLRLFVMNESCCDFSRLFFPASLEKLEIHIHDNAFQECVSSPSASLAASQLIQAIQMRVPTLTHLANILIAGSPELSDSIAVFWDLGGLIYYDIEHAELVRDGVPDTLRLLCKDRNIECLCLKNTFPRLWEGPKYTGQVLR